MAPNLPTPESSVVLKRASYYYNMYVHEIFVYIKYILDPYNMCKGDVRQAIKSDARNENINALTKPEAILLLVALTQPLYEDIKALPHSELPLLINHDWFYPDLKAFFMERLKNG